MGMAQVIATIAYGIRGLQRGKMTWSWPDFNPDPVQENLAQLSQWSLNTAPTWEFPPLAIANLYYDQQGDEVKRARYRYYWCVDWTFAGKTGSVSKKYHALCSHDLKPKAPSVVHPNLEAMPEPWPTHH